MQDETYTIVAVYREPMGQRYCTDVAAGSPEEAERVAQRECIEANGLDPDETDPMLMIAGVFAGPVQPLDMYTDGTFDVPGYEQHAHGRP